ncbi:dTDP-4-dehydrorhamnose reductase [Flavobacteriaceae bacterium]|nr:dTDP-4-dehydrorhamnose reductase [Flavobacteriaceae bacterium]
MNILVTGSNGQLGSEIKDISIHYPNFKFFFMDLPELDICKSSQLEVFFKDKNINTVINCAAYTAVDQAEEDAEIAELVNAKGVLNLVNALKKVDGKLIHISTDYVFDGTSFLPYKESDPVSPIGVYGETKRAGELAVINSDIDSIVIRTSWLYSSYGNNFVKTMLRLGSEKENLGVIFDQVGTPTNASDLAKTCLDILLDESLENISTKGKIYHYSNEGVTSWYDFAKAIMELGSLDCKVRPIQTRDYPTPAKRPHYSVLNKSKIKIDFNIQIPYWRDSLDKCIEKLKTN